MPPMTSTTRAPPPFNPVYNNPLYPGGTDNMYNMYNPGNNRAGFNNIIPFNQTRNTMINNMPGTIQCNVSYRDTLLTAGFQSISIFPTWKISDVTPDIVYKTASQRSSAPSLWLWLVSRARVMEIMLIGSSQNVTKCNNVPSLRPPTNRIIKHWYKKMLMFWSSLWVLQKCTSCLFCEIPLWVTLPLPSASTIYVRQGPIIWQAGEVAKIFARSTGPGSDMINIFLIVHIRGKEGDITQILGCPQ